MNNKFFKVITLVLFMLVLLKVESKAQEIVFITWYHYTIPTYGVSSQFESSKAYLQGVVKVSTLTNVKKMVFETSSSITDVDYFKKEFQITSDEQGRFFYEIEGVKREVKPVGMLLDFEWPNSPYKNVSKIAHRGYHIKLYDSNDIMIKTYYSNAVSTYCRTFSL